MGPSPARPLDRKADRANWTPEACPLPRPRDPPTHRVFQKRWVHHPPARSTARPTEPTGHRTVARFPARGTDRAPGFFGHRWVHHPLDRKADRANWTPEAPPLPRPCQRSGLKPNHRRLGRSSRPPPTKTQNIMVNPVVIELPCLLIEHMTFVSFPWLVSRLVH